MTDPLILAHSRAVAAPKRQPAPAPTCRPVHAMCLAMSEVYQWVAPAPTKAEIVQQAHARLSDASLVAQQAHARLKVGDRVMTVHDGAATVTSLHLCPDLVNVKLDKNGWEGVTGAVYLKHLPAQQFVCIRAHKGTNDWKVGDIAVVVSANEPDNWRPCDAEGWIAHVPTADAECPVPDGVEFEVKRRMGCVSSMDRYDSLWRPRGVDSETEPTAWRPVVQ